MDTQGAHPLHYRLGLRKEFRDNWKKYEPQFPKYLKVSSIDGPEVSASIFTGPNRLLELGDGEPVTYDNLTSGPKVAGVDKEYGLGLMISKRNLEDELYGKFKSAGKWLSHASWMTREYRSAAFLDDAFTGSTFLGIDGLAWCVTNHTFLRGTGTWSNRPAQEVEVSVTGINAALELFYQMKDHNGDPIVMFPNLLIIGNSVGDHQAAMKILNSTLEPFTSNNDDNALGRQMKGLEVVVSRYKISSTSYFLIDKNYNDAHFHVRRNPSLEESNDFDTGGRKIKLTERFLIWGVDPRGWVGVNPS